MDFIVKSGGRWVKERRLDKICRKAGQERLFCTCLWLFYTFHVTRLERATRQGTVLAPRLRSPISITLLLPHSPLLFQSPPKAYEGTNRGLKETKKMPEPQNLDGIRVEKLTKSAPPPETAEWDGKVAKKFEGYVTAVLIPASKFFFLDICQE